MNLHYTAVYLHFFSKGIISVFPSPHGHKNMWRSFVVIRLWASSFTLPHDMTQCTVLKHVSHPSPLWNTALLIFHVMLVTWGPWLCFSLYTDPGENYRQWLSTLCLSLPLLSASRCFDVTNQINVMLSRILHCSHSCRLSHCSCYHPRIWRVLFQDHCLLVRP